MHGVQRHPVTVSTVCACAAQRAFLRILRLSTDYAAQAQHAACADCCACRAQPTDSEERTGEAWQGLPLFGVSAPRIPARPWAGRHWAALPVRAVSCVTLTRLAMHSRSDLLLLSCCCPLQMVFLDVCYQYLKKVLLLGVGAAWSDLRRLSCCVCLQCA
jgi:hypothetical protein